MRLLFVSVLILLCLAINKNLKANDSSLVSAPIPLEAFAGHTYFNLQLIVAKPLANNNRLNFFNVTTLNGSYQNKENENEFFSLSMVNYRIYKGFALTAGVAMSNFTGFRPTAGIQYLSANKELLFVLLPRVDLRDDFNLEGFALLEYLQNGSTRKIKWYGRVQALHNYNTKQDVFDFSYMYFRLGVSVGNFQVGLGANFDWIGNDFDLRQNFGPFVRTTLY
jgi:hypothetical protein